jgi:isocitrate dehydrogenase
MNDPETAALHFDRVTPPEGDRITKSSQGLQVPDRPVIPVIEGDGIGPDIMKAARRVLDGAVQSLYGKKRHIVWFDVFAGESAQKKYGDWLPEDTLRAIRHYVVALKGPLTTPVGGGIRSLNVALRQILDLYACVRPVRYFQGVPSPVREPEKMNVVIFRENTEDVYAGIEWAAETPEANRVVEFLNKTMGAKVREKSAIGIKPISEFGTKRLVRMAIEYAVRHHSPSVTLVHKGNIMKYTEGAFRDWGYETALEEYADRTVREESLTGAPPAGKIVMKDRIADSMFQQILTRTEEYSVLAMPNLNGDYFSDACAAQVGGLGMAPGANIGDDAAVFEATHGTAPKYADKDLVNPGSVILSGAMMLDHLGWTEAADAVEAALEKTILQRKVTYDLARLLPGVTPIKTSEFATAILGNLGG